MKRLLLLVAIALFSFLLGTAISSSMAVDEGQATTQQVELRVRENTFAICVNENILRRALGSETLDLDGCIEEHAIWWEQYQNGGSQPTGDRAHGYLFFG